jgi:fructoselysine-6-P-deglycase FrlB-like protein
LIVQKALDKRETAQLKQAEKLARIKIKQAAAEKKMHQEARRNAIAGLTGSGGSKASGTALADLLRQEDAAYRARRLECFIINTINNQRL